VPKLVALQGGEFGRDKRCGAKPASTPDCAVGGEVFPYSSSPFVLKRQSYFYFVLMMLRSPALTLIARWEVDEHLEARRSHHPFARGVRDWFEPQE